MILQILILCALLYLTVWACNKECWFVRNKIHIHKGNYPEEDKRGCILIYGIDQFNNPKVEEIDL